jgi:hypothetical protein
MDSQSVALSFSSRLSRSRTAAWRYLRGGPGHFFMYVFGRFEVVRSTVVWAHKRRPSKTAVAGGVSLLDDVDTGRAVCAISNDGYFSGLRLRADVLDELRRFSSTTTCFGEEDFQFPFDLEDKTAAEQRYGRKLKVGRFDDVLQTCLHVQGLASDPTLLAIARGYLGTEPVLLGARMWWSFASEADAAQQRSLGQGFHYDIDGYRALAFFFYLTDVTPASGPHVCISGSHKEKPLKALLSLHKSRTDAEIAAWYGTERQMVLCGTAGDGIAEDIFCFHKGLHPESGDRLMLQLRYGLCNYDVKEG